MRLAKSYQWCNMHKPEWANILAPIINVPTQVILQVLLEQTQPSKLVPINEAAIVSAQDVANTSLTQS